MQRRHGRRPTHRAGVWPALPLRVGGSEAPGSPEAFGPAGSNDSTGSRERGGGLKVSRASRPAHTDGSEATRRRLISRAALQARGAVPVWSFAADPGGRCSKGRATAEAERRTLHARSALKPAAAAASSSGGFVSLCGFFLARVVDRLSPEGCLYIPFPMTVPQPPRHHISTCWRSKQNGCARKPRQGKQGAWTRASSKWPRERFGERVLITLEQTHGCWHSRGKPTLGGRGAPLPAKYPA